MFYWSFFSWNVTRLIKTRLWNSAIGKTLSINPGMGGIPPTEYLFCFRPIPVPSGNKKLDCDISFLVDSWINKKFLIYLRVKFHIYQFISFHIYTRFDQEGKYHYQSFVSGWNRNWPETMRILSQSSAEPGLIEMLCFVASILFQSW